MKKLISPYPMLQPGTLNVEIAYKFFFNDDSEQLQEIEYDSEEQILKSKTWSADKFNLKINVELTLSDIKKLFSGPTAVAQNDAEIGIALRCQIAGLNRRRFFVFDNCTLTGESDSVSVKKEITFPRHFLRNQLNWEIVLFLKKNCSDNKIYAKTPGSILGVLDEKTLYTGGGNGVFTTVWKAAGKQAPLWDIELLTQSLDDEFEPSSLVLSLNSDHCAKDLISIDKDKLSPMLFEIFSDVCFVLLKKAASSDFKIDSEVDSIKTLGDYINVMLKKLFPEWGLGDLHVDDHVLMKNIRGKLLTGGIKISTPYAKENGND